MIGRCEICDKEVRTTKFVGVICSECKSKIHESIFGKFISFNDRVSLDELKENYRYYKEDLKEDLFSLVNYKNNHMEI